MQQTVFDLTRLPIVRLDHYLRIPLETNDTVVFLKFGTYLPSNQFITDKRSLLAKEIREYVRAICTKNVS